MCIRDRCWLVSGGPTPGPYRALRVPKRRSHEPSPGLAKGWTSRRDRPEEPVEVVDADADADQSAADAGCPPWAIATAEGVDADAIDDCRLLQGEPLGGGA